MKVATPRDLKGIPRLPPWSPVRVWSLPPKPSFAYPDPDGLPEWISCNFVIDEDEKERSLRGAFGIWSSQYTNREPYTWEAAVTILLDGRVRLVLYDDHKADHSYTMSGSSDPELQAEELFRWLSGLVVWDLGSIHTRLTAVGYQKNY